jgi:hypothetical protein
MTNQYLSQKFILLISSWKFIALNRFFLVREKITSFLCWLIINNDLKIASKRIRIVFFLWFGESNEYIYWTKLMFLCFQFSTLQFLILFFYHESLILEIWLIFADNFSSNLKNIIE